MEDFPAGMEGYWSHPIHHPGLPIRRTDILVTINTNRSFVSVQAAMFLVAQFDDYLQNTVFMPEMWRRTYVPRDVPWSPQPWTYLVEVRIGDSSVEISPEQRRVHGHFSVSILHAGRMDLRESLLNFRGLVWERWPGAWVHWQLQNELLTRRWNYNHELVTVGEWMRLSAEGQRVVDRIDLARQRDPWELAPELDEDYMIGRALPALPPSPARPSLLPVQIFDDDDDLGIEPAEYEVPAVAMEKPLPDDGDDDDDADFFVGSPRPRPPGRFTLP